MTEHLSRRLPPAASTAAVHALLKGELSTPARAGHVALLLASAAATSVVGALWMTEPSLPLRTHVAFGVMVVIGLSWATYATWVLSTRRVLLGRHRVIAGRMAVAFTGCFVAGSILVAAMTGHPAGYASAGLGVGMLVAAAWLLARARRQVARLMERREEIVRTLADRV